MIYVDGFSGPGRYDGGEPGSPLLVLDLARTHSRLPALLARPGFEMEFVFIEEDEDSWINLSTELREYRTQHPLPQQFSVNEPIHGEFNERMETVLRGLTTPSGATPAFVFIDPFGPLGFPLHTVGRIMKNKMCEVFIRFNYTRLANTFLPRRDMEERIDELYGCDTWREARILPSEERERSLIDLYVNQLRRQAVVEFVQTFRTVDPTGHVAYFIFATNGARGFEEMKEAMWKVSPEGNFAWQFTRTPPIGQRTFLDAVATDRFVDELAGQLRNRFAGQTAEVRQIVDWVIRQPGFIRPHVRPALDRLEGAGAIVKVALPGGRRRKGKSYPEEAIISFS